MWREHWLITGYDIYVSSLMLNLFADCYRLNAAGPPIAGMIRT